MPARQRQARGARLRFLRKPPQGGFLRFGAHIRDDHALPRGATGAYNPDLITGERGHTVNARTTKACFIALPLIALLALAGTASAETLLIERVQEENPATLPVRGQSMAQIEAAYGAPAQKMDPRGGQRSQWPTINRWVYPAFTVYFEGTRVIDVVANKAGAEEIGPKPAIL